MIGITREDSISKLVDERTEDLSSGMPWDDDPCNIITVRSFKESGLFLTSDEAKMLDVWLNDYAEMLYFNGKKNRILNKDDVRMAKTVGKFLDEMRSQKWQ